MLLNFGHAQEMVIARLHTNMPFGTTLRATDADGVLTAARDRRAEYLKALIRRGRTGVRTIFRSPLLRR